MKHTFTTAVTAVILLIAAAFGTAAAPTEASTIKPFSFASWVNDLSNPDTVAMTPGQVLEAYNTSRTSAASERDGAGAVFKRTSEVPGLVGCSMGNTPSHTVTTADAVALIAQLAGKGQQQVPVTPGVAQFGIDGYGELQLLAYCGDKFNGCPQRPVIL